MTSVVAQIYKQPYQLKHLILIGFLSRYSPVLLNKQKYRYKQNVDLEPA